LREAGYRTKACGKLHLQPWGLEAMRQKIGGKAYAGLFSHEDETFWAQGKITSIPEGYFGFESTDFVAGHADYVSGDYLNWLDREHPTLGKALRDRFWNAAWAYRQTREDELTPQGIAKSYRMQIPPQLHYNHWIADRVIAYLQQQTSEEPLFLWCSFPDPHHPFAATQPYSEMYDPASLTLPPTWNRPIDVQSGMQDIPRKAHSVQLDRFNEAGLREMLAQTYGMITHIDDNIGRVLDALVQSGRYDNTVIVFLSDHGDYLGSHHFVCKGTHPFEEVMRVPFIWNTSASRRRSHVEHEMTSLLDFAPTILDYAGIDMELLAPKCNTASSPHLQSPWFDGCSLKPQIDKGAALSQRSFIACKDENLVDKDSMIDQVIRVRCYYQGPYKVVLVPTLPGNHCLYNLQQDPHETRNLWDDPSHRQIREQLLLAYAEDAIRTEYAGLGRISYP
jgi:arylsulfatase A-like enzyme